MTAGIGRGLLRGGWAGLWLALATPLVALDPTHKADTYSIHGWFTEQGLPSNKIRAVTQARDGYLWLATGQGITRFDGSRFTNFTGQTNPELRGGGFFAVLEAPDGSLWFGGDNGLFRWRGGHFDHFTTEDGLAHNYVRGLGLTRDGAIVACTRAGFSIMRNGRLTTPGGIWKQPTGFTRCFLELTDGSSVLGTYDGFWRIKGEKIERIAGTAEFPGNAFTCIVETSDGLIWIGYNRGVRCLRPDGKFVDYGAAEGITNPRVGAMRTDRDGNLWIGTYDGGLYRFAHGRLEAAVYPGEIGDAVIQSFGEDREGALWVAAAPGLFRLEDNISRTIGSAEGLGQTSIFSVLEARDGAWWIGSWGGGVYRSDGVRATRLPVPNALGMDQVLALAEEPANTLWIGTNSGLYRHVAGVTVNLFQPQQAALWRNQIVDQPGAILPGIAHPHVNAMAADGEGGLWVATDGALYHGREGRWSVDTSVAELTGNAFKAVVRTRRGDVWIATSDGVACLHEGLWKGYPCGIAISSVLPRSIYEDAAGTIWVTTEGGGLNRLKDGRWRTFTTSDGFADDFISGITEDDSSNLWIAYPRGVMRIPIEQFDAIDAGRRTVLEPRIFNRYDGLPAAEVNQMGSPNAARTRAGQVLFATDRGVAVIEPARLKFNQLVPPVYVERIVIGGTEFDMSHPVVVPPGSTDVQINYTAISLLAPEKVRFKIRLAPLDRDWVEVGNRRDVGYAKLPAGEYKFQVIACNNDGVWNETGAALDFTVQPFFYRTYWFTALVAAAGIATMGGIYWTRVRRARQQLTVLEILVGERTQELRKAKETAEATREDIVRERARFKFIFEELPVGVTWMLQGNLQTRIVNLSHAQMSGVPIARRHQLQLYREATHPEDREILDAFSQKILAREIDRYAVEKRFVHPDGRFCWVSLSVRHFRDSETGEVQEISTIVDITARKAAEVEREKLHGQLLDVSRQAGMAEVATGVLHNVGNVLNSVNVSTTLIADRLRRSRVGRVGKVSELLLQHEGDLARFLTDDPQGRQVSGFLQVLATHLIAEQEEMLKELESLRQNIEHIKDIVAMQQNYAKVAGVVETVAAIDLVNDAVQMNAGALSRHAVKLVRDYQAKPVITVEKHKVLQILVNLLRNAKHACDDSGRGDKQVTVRVTEADGRVRIQVIDNGVGVPAENLARIFSHGFTTRKDGHGFGLHNGALAARELGGSLTVDSEGEGKGAIFTLELPQRAAEKTA